MGKDSKHASRNAQKRAVPYTPKKTPDGRASKARYAASIPKTARALYSVPEEDEAEILIHESLKASTPNCANSDVMFDSGTVLMPESLSVKEYPYGEMYKYCKACPVVDLGETEFHSNVGMYHQKLVRINAIVKTVRSSERFTGKRRHSLCLSDGDIPSIAEDDAIAMHFPAIRYDHVESTTNMWFNSNRVYTNGGIVFYSPVPKEDIDPAMYLVSPVSEGDVPTPEKCLWHAQVVDETTDLSDPDITPCEAVVYVGFSGVSRKKETGAEHLCAFVHSVVRSGPTATKTLNSRL